MLPKVIVYGSPEWIPAELDQNGQGIDVGIGSLRWVASAKDSRLWRMGIECLGGRGDVTVTLHDLCWGYQQVLGVEERSGSFEEAAKQLERLSLAAQEFSQALHGLNGTAGNRLHQPEGEAARRCLRNAHPNSFAALPAKDLWNAAGGSTVLDALERLQQIMDHHTLERGEPSKQISPPRSKYSLVSIYPGFRLGMLALYCELQAEELMELAAGGGIPNAARHDWPSPAEQLHLWCAHSLNDLGLDLKGSKGVKPLARTVAELATGNKPEPRWGERAVTKAIALYTKPKKNLDSSV